MSAAHPLKVRVIDPSTLTSFSALLTGEEGRCHLVPVKPDALGKGFKELRRDGHEQFLILGGPQSVPSRLGKVQVFMSNAFRWDFGRRCIFTESEPCLVGAEQALGAWVSVAYSPDVAPIVDVQIPDGGMLALLLGASIRPQRVFVFDSGADEQVHKMAPGLVGNYIGRELCVVILRSGGDDPHRSEAWSFRASPLGVATHRAIGLELPVPVPVTAS